MISNGQLPSVATAPDDAVDYDDLLARCMDNQDLAQRILARFGQTFGEDLNRFCEAAEAQDADQMAYLAHRLKGASANVSATRLLGVLTELECLVRSFRPDDLTALMEQLKIEWTRFKLEAPLKRQHVAAAD